MRIVQVVTQMEAGGAQKVASLLTEGLRERGHDAQLWFLYKKRPAYKESPYVRVLRHQRPTQHEFAGLGAHLWRELRRHKPDVVITHTHSANGFAAPVAAMAGVPVRVAVHHNPIDTYSHAMRLADLWAFRGGCYSRMVTVSGGVMDSFSGYAEGYRNRMHRIYNGIEQLEAVDEFDVRAEYGIPQGMKLLVNVGRFSEQKNQHVLLRMLQHVPGAFLLLVGDGELKGKLAADAETMNVSSRVAFTGELPCCRVEGVLKQADAFLVPSLYESFCLAAVEAMYRQVPVIATDLPCLREVLGNRQLFFPLNDVEELVRKVRYLLSNKKMQEEMGVAGRAQAGQFSVARMVGEYECLLADALLYAPAYRSTANDFRGFDALGGIPSVHNHP